MPACSAAEGAHAHARSIRRDEHEQDVTDSVPERQIAIGWARGEFPRFAVGLPLFRATAGRMAENALLSSMMIS